jgi:ABC-2 type transport system permease protein
MSLSRVFTLAGRIVRQFVRDRRTMALLFLAPLLVMTLLNFVLNSSSSGATLDIVPAGVLSSQIAQTIQQRLSGQANFTVHIAASADQAENDLKNGAADAALLFPADFSPTASATPLTLRLEGSDPTVAKQVQNVVALLINGLAQGATPGQASGGSQITVRTSYLYGGPQFTATDALAPLFIGLFSFFFVFLLTSVAFLRERSQGTIERLLVSPLNRTELVLGYVLGFTLFALVQSLVILLYVLLVLQVHFNGNLAVLFLVTALLTIGGVNLGIFVSAFARNELQVVQFIPLLIVPQILLGGLFFPVKTLPVVLKQLAYIMPLTYANFGLKDVMIRGFSVGDIWLDLVFLAGFAVLMVLGAAFSLRQDRV